MKHLNTVLVTPPTGQLSATWAVSTGVWGVSPSCSYLIVASPFFLHICHNLVVDGAQKGTAKPVGRHGSTLVTQNREKWEPNTSNTHQLRVLCWRFPCGESFPVVTSQLGIPIQGFPSATHAVRPTRGIVMSAVPRLGCGTGCIQNLLKLHRLLKLYMQRCRLVWFCLPRMVETFKYAYNAWVNYGKPKAHKPCNYESIIQLWISTIQLWTSIIQLWISIIELWISIIANM